jgi:tetratricopeptide (TPR) repeat protein
MAEDRVTGVGPTPPAELSKIIANALNEASALEASSPARALHILRTAISQVKVEPDIGEEKDGIVEFGFPEMFLALRAAEALITAITGQWSSGGPHSFLGMYESLNPTLPERNPFLRLHMNRLRMVAASFHRNWEAMLSYALDQLDNIEGPLAEAHAWDDNDEEIREGYRIETLGNAAVASSHLGLPQTAKALYLRHIAGLEEGTGNYAGALIRYGSYLFKDGDHGEALECYETAIATLASLEDPSLVDVQNHIRALWRRADCLLKSGEHAQPVLDILTAFRLCDRAREMSLYQSARSADSIVLEDMTYLLRVLNRLPDAAVHPRDAIEIFLRASNSSAAAGLRPRRKMTPHTVRYLSEESTAARISAELSTWWRSIDEEDIITALAPRRPTLIVASTLIAENMAAGFSVFLPVTGDPIFHTWQLNPAPTGCCDACGAEHGPVLECLRELLSAPPDSTADALAWGMKPRDPLLGCLAARLLPLEALSSALTNAEPGTVLKICPLGPLWQFPFAALPINGRPLAVTVPVELGTLNSTPVEMSAAPNWAAHFDLHLLFALDDLSTVVQEATGRSVELRLVDDKEQLHEALESSPSLIILSCHGSGVGVAQTLHMSNGSRLNALDMDPVPAGSTFLVDCCWIGAVHDPEGLESLNLPLTLLARGAHSVVGATGPVSDRHAAALLSVLLPQLQRPNVAPSTAMFRAWQTVLGDDPAMPLRAWAIFNTISR